MSKLGEYWQLIAGGAAVASAYLVRTLRRTAMWRRLLRKRLDDIGGGK